MHLITFNSCLLCFNFYGAPKQSAAITHKPYVRARPSDSPIGCALSLLLLLLLLLLVFSYACALSFCRVNSFARATILSIANR